MAPAAAMAIVDLGLLPPRRQARIRRAQQDLFAAIRAFRRAGSHQVREALSGGPAPFERYAHYPTDDVDDVPRGYAWFYHAHAPGESRPWDEHGHFHLYAYPRLLAGRCTPLALPTAGDPAREAGIVHLFGLCMSAAGAPVRLFTINRWASNEHMYAAADLLPVIDRFSLSGDLPYPRVGRWLSGMTRMLQPQLSWLLGERDRVLAERRAVDPEGYTEDRSLDVVSTLAFDLREIHARIIAGAD